MLVVLVQLQQLYDLCRTPLGGEFVQYLSKLHSRLRMKMPSSDVPLQQDWPLQHSILKSSLFGVELVSVTSVSVS